MKLSEDLVNKVNEENKRGYHKVEDVPRLFNGVCGTEIAFGSFVVFELSDLSRQIEELINLRTLLEKETDIRF